MTAERVTEEVTDIFRAVFHEPSLQVTASLTPMDIERWDSITHLDMLSMVEDRFRIRIPTSKITAMRSVGDVISFVMASCGSQ